jgi:protein TonB
MTFAAADKIRSSLPDGKAAVSLLPAKLRVSLSVLVVAAHVCAVVALGLTAQNVNVLEPINVDLIPQGDYMINTVAISGVAAAEAVEQHQMQEPQPQPDPSDTPQAAQPTPEPAQADSLTPPVIAPDPRVKAAELAVLEKQRKLREQRRREAQAEARSREARHRLMAHRDEARNSRSSNQGGSEDHRAGVAYGQAVRAARLNYGAIVSAELNRHKAYPAAARTRGERGSVGASFTIGGSGRIVSHSIYSSSGYSSLDSEVHSMMAAAQAPPPPGGIFHGSIVISFSFGR